MDKLEFDIHDIEYVSGRRPARDINILSDIFGTISASVGVDEKVMLRSTYAPNTF